MAGTFKGRGKLFPGEIEVEYELVQEVVTKPKTSQHPKIVSWSSTITIRRSDEQPIPEGIFELKLEDGSTERVKNHGFQWSVLSPLPA